MIKNVLIICLLFLQSVSCKIQDSSNNPTEHPHLDLNDIRPALKKIPKNFIDIIPPTAKIEDNTFSALYFLYRQGNEFFLLGSYTDSLENHNGLIPQDIINKAYKLFKPALDNSKKDVHPNLYRLEGSESKPLGNNKLPYYDCMFEVHIRGAKITFGYDGKDYVSLDPKTGYKTGLIFFNAKILENKQEYIRIAYVPAGSGEIIYFITLE